MPDTPLGARILKVNHAGENGAIHIYTGQMLLARWTAPSMMSELREFLAHETQHRSIFAAELQRRGAPRCRSYLLCGAGGYLLGVLTSICGRQAIAATTAAVEHVVLAHLQQQLSQLEGHDEAAVTAIRAIIDDERHHHDSAALQVDRQRFWNRVLTPVVAASTEAVIWMGMKL